MKIKILITDDQGETYVGETQLKKADPTKKSEIIIHDERDDPMKILANACGVAVDKLKKIIDYVNNEFIFTGDLDEPDPSKKRAKICQCILTAWIVGKGLEKIDSSTIVEALRKLGMNSRNMHRSINPKDGIFRTEGQKSGLKYSLTIPGWKNGLSILKAESQKL